MRRTVRLTANFESNLQAIGDFLRDAGTTSEFDRLLTKLFDELIPNLAAFAHLGRSFLAREPLSVEGQMRRERMRNALGSRTELREYISGDYLVLYAVRSDGIFLLSIKHHRQLSFDLRAFWSE